MVKNTREQILQNAKMLFTLHGYNAVSIQDIARECGISKGNLTYYFSKKEQILEALLDASADETFFIPAQTPDELHAIFLHQKEIIESNAYYFWHHAQMGQISEKIRKQQAETHIKIRNLYKDSIENLIANGFMKREDPSGRRLEGEVLELVIDAIVMGVIYWLPYHYPDTKKADFSLQDDLLRYCWNQLTPWRR